MGRLSLTLVVLLASVVLCNAFSQSQLTTIKDALETMFDENRSDDGNHFPLAHKCVRLSFHDCVGGCDGCLNINNPDNAGLADTITTLDNFYKETGTVDGGSIEDLTDFGRADLWALAGSTALEFLSKCPKKTKPCTGFTVPFKYGRTDCTSATVPFTDANNELPSAHDGYDATIKFFADNFSFTEREAIAILGAHTIGKASSKNSGFRGRWVAKWDSVDNAYYTDLTNASLNWEQENVRANNPNREPRWQWNNDNTFMMLNADMCLVKDITVETDGEATCSYATCNDSPGKSIVDEYAASNTHWLDEFVPTFVKMVEKINSGSLSDVAAATAKKTVQDAEEALLVKLLVKDLQQKHTNDAN